MRRRTPSAELLYRASLTTDDTERGQLISRACDLQVDAPLSAASAVGDLNACGFFHVQPCHCDHCRRR